MSDNSYPAFLPPHYKTVYDIDIDLRKQLAYFHDDPNRFPLLMHAHNFYELNIIVRGHGRHYIEKKNYPANPGDVFAIPPKIQHGYWADGDMSIFHILIESSMLEKYNNTINRFPGFYTLFETEPHVRKNANNVTMFLRLGEKKLREYIPLMEHLHAIAIETNPANCHIFEFSAMAFILELSELIEKGFYVETPNAKEDYLRLLITTVEYMRKNLSNNIELNELTKISGYSRTRYLQLFKQLFNCTPFRYLNKLRIEHALALLRTTDFSVTFIAQSCGFFDCSHFIHVFRNTVGTTPAEYRKQNKY